MTKGKCGPDVKEPLCGTNLNYLNSSDKPLFVFFFLNQGNNLNRSVSGKIILTTMENGLKSGRAEMMWALVMTMRSHGQKILKKNCLTVFLKNSLMAALVKRRNKR